MAFATRCHRHLWGKNNEDPLAYLYLKGLTLDFTREMYLGWNKHGQERSYSNWGIDAPGKFIIPPGILLPYIVEKKLKSLYIISMSEQTSVFQVPGSDSTPLVFNKAAGSRTGLETGNLLGGLVRLQTNPGDFICITPDLNSNQRPGSLQNPE